MPIKRKEMLFRLFDEQGKGWLVKADLDRLFRVISNDLNLNPLTKEDFNILAYKIAKSDATLFSYEMMEPFLETILQFYKEKNTDTAELTLLTKFILFEKERDQ